MEPSDILQIISIVVAIFFGVLTLKCNKELKKVKKENHELNAKIKINNGVVASEIQGGVKIG